VSPKPNLDRSIYEKHMEQAIVYLTHRSCHHNTTPGLLSNIIPLSNSCSRHSVPAGSSINGDTCTILLRLLALVVEEMGVRKENM
jgi:hypothetical protein